jgi:hypothetical protein
VLCSRLLGQQWGLHAHLGLGAHEVLDRLGQVGQGLLGALGLLLSLGLLRLGHSLLVPHHSRLVRSIAGGPQIRAGLGRHTFLVSVPICTCGGGLELVQRRPLCILDASCACSRDALLPLQLLLLRQLSLLCFNALLLRLLLGCTLPLRSLLLYTLLLNT